jgi:hypothetical protein
VAGLAIGTELGGGMRRIVGLGVIILVTSITGSGKHGGVIHGMAFITIYGQMCAGKYKIGVMKRKSSRFPAGIQGMAVLTSGWERRNDG